MKIKGWLIGLGILVIMAIIGRFVKESEPVESGANSSDTTVSSAIEENSVPEPQVIDLPVKDLILSPEEVDNSVIDPEWSRERTSHVKIAYKKAIDLYTERAVDLELYKYADSVEAITEYKDKQMSFFSRTVTDSNGKQKKNNFYSERVYVPKIGDASFCYDFVSPTVVARYKNYIMECNVTISYKLQNISANDSKTLAKAVSLLKKQVQKIDKLTTPGTPIP